MSRLARLTLRGRVGQVAALAATVFFSALLVGAFGLLLETGLRGQVSTGEYADAPLLVAALQSIPVDSDVPMAVPGRALLPAALAGEIARALPTSRVVADRIVPATFEVAGADVEPVDAHPWSAFALGNRELSSGHAPVGSGEIVLPGWLAHSLGLRIGSVVELGFGDQALDYTLVGTTTADDAGIDVPDVYLSDAQIAAHGNPDRQVAAIGVWPQQYTDTATVARLAARYGAVLWGRESRGQIEVVSQGEVKDDLVSSSAALGAIALIVALFTVTGLTSLQIRERSRELAVFRIVGATPRQVRRLLRAEIRVVAALAGFLGGLAGPFLGRLVISALRAWGSLPRTLHPVFGPLPFAGAMLTGLVAAEIAARVAVRRVVRDSPLAQLEGGDRQPAGSRRTVRRTVAGLTILAVGTVMALAPAYTSNADAAGGLPGISGLVMALSIGPLSPLVVRAAAWSARRPAARTAAAYAALAAVRHRAARVGGALTPIVLGITLSTVQFSTAATSDAVAAAQVQAGYRADITVVTSSTGIGAQAIGLIRDLPGVGLVTPFVTAEVIVQAPAGTGNGPQTLNALAVAGDETEHYADLESAGDGGEDPIRLRQGEVALSVLGAAELGAHVGDGIGIVLPDGRAITCRVSDLYERGLGFGDVLLPIGDLQPATASGFASGLAVTVAASQSVPQVESRIRDRLADVPGAEVTASAPDAGGSGGAGGSSSGEATGLLILIILFGYIAIAVANSLITAALARRPEFALLETVGATPSQRRAILRWEAVFLAATACITGTAIALPGLIAMTYALSDGDRLAPAIDPIAYAGILVFTFLLVLGATALAGKSIIRDRPARNGSRPGSRGGGVPAREGPDSRCAAGSRS